MEEQDHKKMLLKKAKLVTNLGVLVVAVSAGLLLLLATKNLFPNAFKFSKDSKQDIVQTHVITEYDAFFGLDSTEVINGIHIPTGLVADTGVVMVRATCTACHSAELVTQNKADRKGWKDIIVWMQETQGLWDLGTNEDLVLTYLAKNYAPEDTGRRRNLKNIEWYDL